MKPYGIPRIIGAAQYADLADIAKFGLKSSVSRVRSKSGDIKNSFRNPDSKQSRRRIYKTRARQEAKREIINVIDEINSEVYHVDE
jgi:hypothetical protein